MSRRRSYQKDVTDAEAEKATASHLMVLMASVLRSRTAEPVEASKPQSSKKDDRQDNTLGPTLEHNAYLSSILEKPLLSTVARRDYLGLSTYKADRIKKELVKEGLLFELSLNLGRESGGIVKVARLTDAGYRVLVKRPPPSPQFAMGPEHAFWEQELASWWQAQGEDALIEYELNGKRADIALLRKGGPVAVEIETTPKNIVPNVRRDLEAGFARVIVVCISCKLRDLATEKLCSVLDEEAARRVQVKAISEFSLAQEIAGRARRQDKRTTTDFKGNGSILSSGEDGNG